MLSRLRQLKTRFRSNLVWNVWVIEAIVHEVELKSDLPFPHYLGTYFGSFSSREKAEKAVSDSMLSGVEFWIEGSTIDFRLKHHQVKYVRKP